VCDGSVPLPNHAEIIHRNFAICPTQNAAHAERLLDALRVIVEAAKLLIFLGALTRAPFILRVPL
jgi:hypothetical protein